MKTCLYAVLLGSVVLISCSNRDDRFDASGTFEATEVIISSEVNGRIGLLDVTEGQVLDSGMCVGWIDSTQLYFQKQQLLSSVQGVESRKPDIRKQIATLKQQLATAQKEYERMKKLVAAQAANQKQLDDMEASVLLLNKQIASQQSVLDQTTSGADKDVEGLKYQLLQVEDQLRKCRLVNPQKGSVLARYAETNEVATPGKPLYKIADVSRLFLRAYITADQLTQLKSGDQVDVWADFADDYKKYPGTVTWISDKAEFTPKGISTRDERATQVYAVKIAVENDGYLKIGQFGEVGFPGLKKK